MIILPHGCDIINAYEQEGAKAVKKKRKWLKWVIVLAVLAVVGGWLYLASGTTASIAYNEYAVTQGSLTTYYNFDGLVHAPRIQTLTAAGEDTVDAVYVAQGQQVQEGDRLLRMKSGQTVRAGVDGEVTNLPVAQGDMVAAGAQICEIIDMNRLQVRLNVDEYDVAAVIPGCEVEVTVLATGEVCSGTVVSLNKNGTASGDLSYYTATVSLNGTKQAYPGMQVSAKLLRGQVENAPILRLDAVSFDEYNLPYVLMRNGDAVVRVPVTIGISDGVYAHIATGVQAGDTVLKESGMTMAELMTLMQGGM